MSSTTNIAIEKTAKNGIGIGCVTPRYSASVVLNLS